MLERGRRPAHPQRALPRSHDLGRAWSSGKSSSQRPGARGVCTLSPVLPAWAALLGGSYRRWFSATRRIRFWECETLARNSGLVPDTRKLPNILTANIVYTRPATHARVPASKCVLRSAKLYVDQASVRVFVRHPSHTASMRRGSNSCRTSQRSAPDSSGYRGAASRGISVEG